MFDLFQIKRNNIKEGYVFLNKNQKHLFRKIFSYAKPFFNGYALVKHKLNIDFIDQKGEFYFYNFCLNKISTYRTNYEDLQSVFSCVDGPEDIYEINEEKYAFSYLPGGKIPFYRWIRMTDGFLIHINIFKLIEKIKLDINDQEINSKKIIKWFEDKNISLRMPYFRSGRNFSFDKFLKREINPKYRDSKAISKYEYIRGYFYLKTENDKVVFYGPYEEINYSQDGYIPIKEFGNKAGYINSFENVFVNFSDLNPKRFIIEPKYDSVYPFSEGLAKVRLKNKFGYINVFGAFVVIPKYADARAFNNGMAVVADFESQICEEKKFDDNFFLWHRYKNNSNGYRNKFSKSSGFKYFIIDRSENVIQKYFFKEPIIYIGNINDLLEFNFSFSSKLNKLNVDYLTRKKLIISDLVENDLLVLKMKLNEDQSFRKFKEDRHKQRLKDTPPRVFFMGRSRVIWRLKKEVSIVNDIPDFIIFKKEIAVDEGKEPAGKIINNKLYNLVKVDELNLIQYDIDPSRIDILNEYYMGFALGIRRDQDEAARDAMNKRDQEKMFNDEMESWGDDGLWNID